MSKSKKNLLNVLEQECERVEAISKYLLKKKNGPQNPIVGMQVTMASNCLRVACYAAGKEQGDGIDKGALAKQFVDFLGDQEQIAGKV